MADVLSWQDPDGRRDLLHRAAAALATGRLVAFPTGTGYAAAGLTLAPDALDRLAAVAAGPWPVALASPAAAPDWIPDISALGRRLSWRCWPGPVVLQWADGAADGLAARLPEAVHRHVWPDGTLALTVPDHDAPLLISRLLPGPFSVAELPDVADAAAVRERWGSHLDLIVADDPEGPAAPATVVRLRGEQWELVRPGAVAAADVDRLTARVLLFVCTGNTCRSPMAEGLCKKLLADRLGADVAELPRRGYVVLSAGLSAAPGGPAAAEAVATLHGLGADLTDHASQPLTPRLLQQADHVFAMTSGHLRALHGHCPAAATVDLLSPDGDDIADPIGGDAEVYQRCAGQILQSLEARLGALLAG